MYNNKINFNSSFYIHTYAFPIDFTEKVLRDLQKEISFFIEKKLN
jgi:hypothetical protein